MRFSPLIFLLSILLLAASCVPDDPLSHTVPGPVWPREGGDDGEPGSDPFPAPTPESRLEGLHLLKGDLQAMAVAQSMAVFGNKMFTISAKEEVTVTDILTYKSLGAFSLSTGSYSALHANTSCFGRYFAHVGDEFPLLYVSQWQGDEDRGVLAYRITGSEGKYNAELVQAILPDPSMEKIGKGAADWVVDYDSGYLYCFSYKLFGNSASILQDNAMVITQFDLPSPADGAEVILTDEDVVRQEELEMMLVTQDKCYRNGEIFIVSGSHTVPGSLRLRTVSLLSLSVNRDIDLSLYVGEPEGLDFGPDGKLLGTYYYVPCLYHYYYESITEDHSGHLQSCQDDLP